MGGRDTVDVIVEVEASSGVFSYSTRTSVDTSALGKIKVEILYIYSAFIAQIL